MAMAGWGLLLNLLPTPSFTQYNACLLPFLVVTAVDGGRALGAMGPSRKMVIGALLVLYVGAFPLELVRYASWGRAVPGIGYQGNGATSWRIDTVKRIGTLAERYHALDEPHSLSWWPGYFLETRIRPVPAPRTTSGATSRHGSRRSNGNGSASPTTRRSPAG